MKKIIISLILAIVASFGTLAQTQEVWSSLEKDINFFLANDLGRNGYYEQMTIAGTMGLMAETIGPECIVAAGDVHHFDGVQSVEDPLWQTNYEWIYSHPELMIEWMPILGNHEYRGNTQAVLDYSRISRRWEMPARYYTKVLEQDGTTVRIVLLDTTPLIDKYRENREKYPDAGLQAIEPQLSWLDAVLGAAKEDWIIVVGHHPVYAGTDKEESERHDMQRRVDTILRKHGNVDMYLCGHIHNFQHIRVRGSEIDYIVNSSASLSREVVPAQGTLFSSPEAGFSVIAADGQTLSLHMVDKAGKVLYTVSRNK